jgi:YD repeat-containing protein
VAQKTREYFDVDERLAYHVSQGGRITAMKYDAATGAVSTSVADFDTGRALPDGWTFIDKNLMVLVPPVQDVLKSIRIDTSTPNVIEDPYHQVSTIEYDALGRVRAETGSDGVRSEVWRGKLANELSTTIRVPAVIGPATACWPIHRRMRCQKAAGALGDLTAIRKRWTIRPLG